MRGRERGSEGKREIGGREREGWERERGGGRESEREKEWVE